MKIASTAAAALAMAAPAEAQERSSVAPRTMQAIAPALADYTDRVLFGDMWVRPELAPRDRSLVTLSVLIATGRTAQMASHLGRGLDNGIKPTEVAGMVTQLAFYTGWPNAVSALNEVETVFAARHVDPASLAAPAPGTASGAASLPDSDDARAAAVEATLAPIASKLAQLTNEVVFADLWRRTDLLPRDRSLVTIAALAAGGDGDQLAFHVGRGLENGLTRAQVVEALTHLAFYAGWPKANAAIAIAGTVFATKESAAMTAVQIVHPGHEPKPGPADYFTGSVSVASPFKGTGDARLGGATVTFQPGAHTNWHTHPLGQLLVVTAGHGWVQVDGETAKPIATGDTVFISPGVKHWHGAARDTAMTHVAVSEARDGSSVTWLEPVADDLYTAL